MKKISLLFFLSISLSLIFYSLIIYTHYLPSLKIDIIPHKGTKLFDLNIYNLRDNGSYISIPFDHLKEPPIKSTLSSINLITDYKFDNRLSLFVLPFKLPFKTNMFSEKIIEKVKYYLTSNFLINRTTASAISLVNSLPISKKYIFSSLVILTIPLL